MAELRHVPVLCAAVRDVLAPAPGKLFLDLTFGGGGHSAALLEAAPCRVIAADRDPEAVARGAALAARFGGLLSLREGRASAVLASLAEELGPASVDGILLDLGVSSFQLDDPARGFSFRFNGPLDMRMEKTGPSAADLVNHADEAELARILHDYGEERLARRIARAIVARRREAPFTTTEDLAALIRAVAGGRGEAAIDPATRSFQALRIAVNDELGELDRALTAALPLLRPGGRLAVIAFHSLEDRRVKAFMREASGAAPRPSRHEPDRPGAEPAFRLVTRQAIRPDAAECAANPRARSARLRVLERMAAEMPAVPEALLP
jgi:16S rRNA (cytosine1402-N4)-methyltransferase